jgi:hypothetical protein
MSKEYDYASDGLRSIADQSLGEAGMCRFSRNILLGIGALTETIIWVVDLAGVDYHSPTLSPYILNGGGWLAVAGIAHFSGRHWEKMSEDFREGARDVEVLDTYSNPDEWDRVVPEE